jgi:hypothetical protein
MAEDPGIPRQSAFLAPARPLGGVVRPLRAPRDPSQGS